MISSTALRNPKSYAFSREGRTLWYEYYACYSPEFVEDILHQLNLPSESVILDPWNGSGTTTFVANQCGFSAIGLDINPVMVVVAKARLITIRSAESIKKKLTHIMLTRRSQQLPDSQEEPLLNWLKPATAKYVRQLEMAIRETSPLSSKAFERSSLKSLKPSTAFFYLALFRALRRILYRYCSSNPTWFKYPSKSDEKISLSDVAVCTAFLREVEELLSLDNASLPINTDSSIHNSVCLASSRNIPLKKACIDAVIASPPYCTRIDYAIATRPELAVLGFSKIELRRLRESMIGSPTIHSEELKPDYRWGKECNKFLRKVKSHSAKASASYYYKNHLQYFDSMFESLLEIDRVLKVGGNCVLVVQDSYYKEIRNNLPRILKDMALTLRWETILSKAFSTTRTFARINSENKKYSSVSKRQEQIIVFRKGV